VIVSLRFGVGLFWACDHSICAAQDLLQSVEESKDFAFYAQYHQTTVIWLSFHLWHGQCGQRAEEEKRREDTKREAEKLKCLEEASLAAKENIKETRIVFQVNQYYTQFLNTQV